MAEFMAYHRVSTDRQGASGLGLAAPREAGGPVPRCGRFVSERGSPLTGWAVHRIIAEAGHAASLPFPMHPYMLRHAGGFYLANKGVDTRALQ